MLMVMVMVVVVMVMVMVFTDGGFVAAGSVRIAGD